MKLLVEHFADVNARANVSYQYLVFSDCYYVKWV